MCKQTDGFDIAFAERVAQIRGAADDVTVSGTTYYVSAEGDDAWEGTSPSCPWKTLARVSGASLCPGDGVRFRRGDVFRGALKASEGVTYAAYGEGEKPRLYGWERDLAEESLWELYDADNCVWRHTQPILDCGTLVFDGGAAHSRKQIPSYINGQFVLREDESYPFVIEEQLTEDLDIVCLYDERLSTEPTRGMDFPIPIVDDKSFGTLYLRCDRGNPGRVFSSIEALPKRNMLSVGSKPNVTVDNLCFRYIGAHAVAANGHVVGLQVSNCEFGWIGGSIQHYRGTDPNYPQGGRGTVTRYGNGVEVYGGCEDYTVRNCYFYQIYDAAITHQKTTNGKKVEMKRIRYEDNAVENCVYSIEYFLEKTEGDTESYMEDVIIRRNFLRLCGYGWGQQRHNKDTPAHVKGWNYENTARGFLICDNVMDRSAYRMIHLVAKEQQSLPCLSGNTYRQYEGGWIGQYGVNTPTLPPMVYCDKDALAYIHDELGDTTGKLTVIEKE